MPSRSPQPVALPAGAVTALLSERDAFRRFLARRVGNESDADDLLQTSLLRALQRGGGLRRGERAVAWFYRILRRAVADHFRARSAQQKRLTRLERELVATNPDTAGLPRDWDAALCGCFAGVLPSLPPRYADLIRRVDLKGEPRALLARELRISVATLDVALHRARSALRRRLEAFCGPCAQDSCFECQCDPQGKPIAKTQV